MKRKLKLPAELGSPAWPHKIDPDKIIKAESHCLIVNEQWADGSAVVMKMYYRRGLANFIRGIILNFRAQREYRISRHLADCGVPCGVPVFWTYGYCREHGFYDILYTRRIPDTLSLAAFLSSASQTDQTIDLGPLFQLLCDMHQCGVYHGALSTKNILVDATDDAQVKFYVIDLARGWLFPDSILGQRIAWFDILKLVRKIESHLGSGHCQPLLERYGLGKEAIEKFYQEAGRYKLYSRKQKRIKNMMKVKVFLFALRELINHRLRWLKCFPCL
jgi:tRNA A-37 threonylcarbamoyl transferase component Bud32